MSEKNNTPQEIDLIELFSNIGNWFSDLFRKAFNLVFITIGLNFVYFLLRNAVAFAIFIVLGIAAGFTIDQYGKKYYRTEMIVKSHTIGNIEAIRKLNSWNIATVFNEDEQELIKEIGATYVLDVNEDGIWDVVEDIESAMSEEIDTTIAKQRYYGVFSVQALVYDTTVIMSLKEKAFNYLENNKRVKDLNTIRLKQQEKLIPILQKEMADLDSLKKYKYFEDNALELGKSLTGDMFMLNKGETKLYHLDVLELYKQQQSLERALYLHQDPFEIIVDFSIPTVEENTITKEVFRFVKYFIVLAFILIGLFDQRKWVKGVIQKSRE